MDVDKLNTVEETARSLFDTIRRTDSSGTEYWEARELAEVLDYA
jgi:hypothetical protein